MIITLLCDNKSSWIIPYIYGFKEKLLQLEHKVNFIDDYRDINQGDIAIFLSCEKIIPIKYRKLNKHNLVIHESDLPEGKGWSPLTWQVIEGKNEIISTLFEAEDKVDTGKIYIQKKILLDGTELIDKIKEKQWQVTEELILEFLNNYSNIEGKIQRGEGSYYRRRYSKDSELDINKSINKQFDLLRVVDNDRYPAFFIRKGKKYVVKVYEVDDEF